jgi:glycosyltransferase involved in cell wall biosynthesis
MVIVKKIIKIIHAGSLYPKERDPTALFRGVEMLINKNKSIENKLIISFYGVGDPNTIEKFRKLIRKAKLNKVIKFYSSVLHLEMLQKLTESDVLLLLQGASCDFQIPAKTYEYFRIGKPILALTTENGETGRLIIENNAGIVAPMDNPSKVAEAIEDIVKNIKKGISLPVISKDRVTKFSRKKQSKKLVQILDSFEKRMDI